MNVTMMRMKPLVVELRRLNRLIEIWLGSQGIVATEELEKPDDELFYTNDEQAIVEQLKEAGETGGGDLAAKIRKFQEAEWDTEE